MFASPVLTGIVIAGHISTQDWDGIGTDFTALIVEATANYIKIRPIPSAIIGALTGALVGTTADPNRKDKAQGGCNQ